MVRVPVGASRRLALTLALALVVAFPGTSEALTYNVQSMRKYMSGPARVVEMRGSYARSNKQENLTLVRIVALGANGQMVSAARGTFDKGTKTWKAGVGDFRLVSFYTEFTVTTPSGGYTLKTPTYRW